MVQRHRSTSPGIPTFFAASIPMAHSSTLHPGSACLECRRRKTVRICHFDVNYDVFLMYFVTVQRCDGVQPICGRCHRLNKTCAFEAIVRKPHIERLEEKVQVLEDEIEAFSRRPAALSHNLLRRLNDEGNSSRHPTPQPRPVLPIFPNLASNQGFGTVTAAELDEGYNSVIPRSNVEASLHRWTAEIPSDLRENLCVTSHYDVTANTDIVYVVFASFFLSDIISTSGCTFNHSYKKFTYLKITLVLSILAS